MRNLFSDNVFMIGDLVQYKGRGGCERTEENVWEIIGIEKNVMSDRCGAFARVRLLEGLIHGRGPGYVRCYTLKSLKHYEVGA